MQEFTQYEGLNYSNLRAILRKKTPKEHIKERQGQGKLKLNYVSGQYVTNTLIEATDNTYSFEIINFQIVKSEKKVVKEWNEKYKKYTEIILPDGTKKKEEQAPYVIIHGRLTIPGLGMREQFGSSELYGGVGEQSESFKAATTDCFKKCCSLFGIALDLYEGLPAPTIIEEPSAPGPTATRTATTSVPKKTYAPKTAPEKKKDPFLKEDLDKIKELKEKLNIKENKELDVYVKEFSGDKEATFLNITPANIKNFNVFLGGKVGE